MCPTERHPPGLQCRFTNRCRGDVARHEVHADEIRNGASVRQKDERIPPVFGAVDFRHRFEATGLRGCLGTIDPIRWCRKQDSNL